MKLPNLTFKPDLEREFIKDYNINSLLFIRLALILTIVLYAIFGVLDFWTLPATREKAWIIRFGVVLPVLSALIALSYVKKAWTYIQSGLLLGGVITGIGIVAMIGFAEEYEPGYSSYYSGLMIVIAGIFTILRLRFYYAIIASLIIVAAYELVALFLQDMTVHGFESRRFLVFINNNFFFLSALAVGVFASFTLEYYIRQVFRQRKIIDLDNRRITALLDSIGKELVIARAMQRSIMPEKPPQIEGARINVIYKPMEELGGDYYDFIDLGEKRKGIFISDATGHGIPAALVTSMLKTLVSSAGDAVHDPGMLLSYINRGIKDIATTGFITACYAILDTSAMELVYARAGHPFPIVCRRGETIVLASRGSFIGPIQDIRFESKRIGLQPGDRILLFTDGLTEASDKSGHLFENILCKEVLRSLQKEGAPFLNQLYHELVSFRGSEIFEDDMCLIGIEIL